MTQHSNAATEYDWPVLKMAPSYVEGSAAPEIVPEDKPVKKPSQKKKRKLTDEELKERRRLRKKAAMRKRQNRTAAFYFALSVGAACALLVTYVQVQSKTNIYLRSIANLEGQIESLKADNDATEIRLSTAVGLDSVKAQAEEMGMSYATDESIITFEIENVDYMSQYAKMN